MVRPKVNERAMSRRITSRRGRRSPRQNTMRRAARAPMDTRVARLMSSRAVLIWSAFSASRPVTPAADARKCASHARDLLPQGAQGMPGPGEILFLGGGDEEDKIMFIACPEIPFFRAVLARLSPEQGFPGRSKAEFTVQELLHFLQDAEQEAQVQGSPGGIRRRLIQEAGKELSHHAGRDALVHLFKKIDQGGAAGHPFDEAAMFPDVFDEAGEVFPLQVKQGPGLKGPRVHAVKNLPVILLILLQARRKGLQELHGTAGVRAFDDPDERVELGKLVDFFGELNQPLFRGDEILLPGLELEVSDRVEDGRRGEEESQQEYRNRVSGLKKKSLSQDKMDGMNSQISPNG